MREMHSRASSYLQTQAEHERCAENENSNQNSDKTPDTNSPHNNSGAEIKDDGNDSSLILTILMILLSQGGADDKLLLALIYLLF